MKKMMSLLLVCVMLISLLPMYAVAAEVEEVPTEEEVAEWEALCEAVAGAPTCSEEAAAAMEGTSFAASVQAKSTSFKESEPNNTMSTADRIYNDYTVTGTISSSDRIDYFKFVLSSKSEVSLLSLSTRKTFMIGIIDSTGDAVAAGLYMGYDDGYYCNYIDVTLPAGTYYVGPLDTNANSNVYAFSIEWTPVASTHTHSYSQYQVVEPTCTAGGYTVMKCSCGATYNTNSTDALGHSYQVSEVVEAVCNKGGYTVYKCERCGAEQIGDSTDPTGEHVYTDDLDPSCNVCGEIREIESEDEVKTTTAMYRLYNPNSGEHFYTGSIEEREMLVTAGWNYEGIGWYAPIVSGDPVYRVYNPNSGDHHYTMNQAEVNMLVDAGWKYEGVCWNSATVNDIPLYRMWNPNADCGSHHYTASAEERENLVAVGWIYEGIGWYGLAS